MFERFTDRARRVLVLAQEEARVRCHTFIATPPPFTTRAKKVLELALREASQLGHSYIGIALG
jgi:ATP-dependent Clp protease ATP-binding subunit ClpC